MTFIADNLIITRIWNDEEFFQIEVECKTKHISVKEKIYTTDALINNLYNQIETFLSGKKEYVFWENGEKGDSSTPCFIVKIFHKDKLGRVVLEIFLEIDDGGPLSAHNCCFYINTELGLLYQFKEDILNLKISQVGIKVSLLKDIQ